MGASTLVDKKWHQGQRSKSFENPLIKEFTYFLKYRILVKFWIELSRKKSNSKDVYDEQQGIIKTMAWK